MTPERESNAERRRAWFASHTPQASAAPPSAPVDATPKPPLSWQEFRAAHRELSAREATPLWQAHRGAVFQARQQNVTLSVTAAQPPTEAELFERAAAQVLATPPTPKPTPAPAPQPVAAARPPARRAQVPCACGACPYCGAHGRPVARMARGTRGASAARGVSTPWHG